MEENSRLKSRKRISNNLVLHLHPKKVKADALKFNRTFGLGGMAALLVVMQVFTGVLLKLHYIPDPARAYESILTMLDRILFGQLVRNIHHWSAVLLLLITFLHMLRVFFTGAYRKPRHVNWIIGVFLLILVVLSNFTGYLLPWDQLSYWAITISTNLLEYVPLAGRIIHDVLLGGAEVSASTLSNFFFLHTVLIPTVIIVLMSFHFWRVRRAGGIILPEPAKDSPQVSVYPNLVSMEFVVSIVLIAAVLLLSVFFNAPLQEKASPGYSPNPAKAPWYFMGLQELLIHFHPTFGIFLIPVLVLTGVFTLPFLPFWDKNYGQWFLSPLGIRSSLVSMGTAFLFTLAFVLLGEFLPRPERVLPNFPPVITRGLVPLVLVSSTMYWFIITLKNKLNLKSSECVQALTVVFIVSYATLTLVGVFFRGQGMQLAWPLHIN